MKKIDQSKKKGNRSSVMEKNIHKIHNNCLGIMKSIKKKKEVNYDLKKTESIF